MKKKKTLFIVEDDPGFNKILSSYLSAKNKWEIHSFQNGEDCLEHIDLNPDIVLQDFDLPKMNGIEVMKHFKLKLPEAEFIFLSGQTDIKVAVEAMHEGAYDYIVKDTYAKENALNKIDQIVKYKDLIEDKRTNKIVLVCSLSLNLVILVILFFIAHLK